MTKPTTPPSRPSPKSNAEKAYLPGDPIPAADAVEKNSDTAWALFEDVAAKEQHRYADTAPMSKPGEVHRMPVVATRTTGTSLIEKALGELTRQNRVCPVPAQWGRFFEELVRGKSSDDIASLAPPMTGNAWTATSSLAKRMTMKDQISWAEANGKTDAAYKFLVRLRESDWFHVGDPTSGA
ncbi:MAG: hypothetical protein ABIR26_18260 [Ramlibacter sp.]